MVVFLLFPFRTTQERGFPRKATHPFREGPMRHSLECQISLRAAGAAKLLRQRCRDAVASLKCTGRLVCLFCRVIWKRNRSPSWPNRPFVRYMQEVNVGRGSNGRILCDLFIGPRAVPFYPFLVGRVPLKQTNRKKGTLIPTSPLEDLVFLELSFHAQHQKLAMATQQREKVRGASFPGARRLCPKWAISGPHSQASRGLPAGFPTCNAAGLLRVDSFLRCFFFGGSSLEIPGRSTEHLWV